MTEDELFEQLQRNLNDEIERELASRRAPIRRGGNSVQQVAEELGINALRRIPHARWYAVASDPDARRELAALAIACRKSKTSIVHALEIISQIVPGWLQERPAEDAGRIPPLPVDPVTGLRIQNPFEGEMTSDKARSREVIKTWSPRLAKWLQDAATNQGVTARMIDELEAEKLEADAVRKTQYSDKQWAENKLRKDLFCTITEQGEFAKSIEDPALLAFHRKEAATPSPRCGYDNLTHRMALAKRDPEIREIHKAAHEILKGWQAEAQREAA